MLASVVFTLSSKTQNAIQREIIVLRLLDAKHLELWNASTAVIGCTSLLLTTPAIVNRSIVIFDCSCLRRPSKRIGSCIVILLALALEAVYHCNSSLRLTSIVEQLKLQKPTAKIKWCTVIKVAIVDEGNVCITNSLLHAI